MTATDESAAEPPHPTRGVHVLADLWGADPRLLDDPAYVMSALRQAAEAAHATVLQVNCHRFAPQGVTAIALLAESHLAIHTWPEHGYAAVDVMSRGTTMRPHAAVDVLREALAATDVEVTVAARGTPPGQRPAPQPAPRNQRPPT